MRTLRSESAANAALAHNVPTVERLRSFARPAPIRMRPGLLARIARYLRQTT